MFWSRFSELCSKSGNSPNGVAKAVDISSGAVTGWKNGKQPSGDTLVKLCSYFGVSAGYLLGLEDTTAPDAPKSTTDDDLVDLLTGLPPGDAAKVKAFIAGLKAGQKQRKE